LVGSQITEGQHFLGDNMNVIKRVFNIWFAWLLVSMAPFAAIAVCAISLLYKLLEGKYPSDQCEKMFRFLCLGEYGVLSIDKKPEAE